MTGDPRVSDQADEAGPDTRGSFHARGRRLPTALALLALAVGLSMLIAGLRHDAPAAQPVPAATPAPAAAPPAPSTTPPPPLVVAASGPFQPTRLTIPSLGVSAPVVPVSTRADGQMAIPDDPETIGWWAPGAKANSATANAVLAGHIFNRAFGPGAFFHLQSLQPGDRVIATGKDGSGTEYTVSTVEVVPKSEFPAARIFTSDGPHHLVLATCGNYDARTGRYRDNVLVYAEPTAP